jgi:hypothetical protein
MSAIHPRGTRLAAAAAASAAAATPASGGKSGHTLWLRTHNPDGSAIGTPAVPISTSTGGGGGGGDLGGGGTTINNTPASGGKSGATLHARAVSATIGTVEKYFLIGALIVMSVYVVRRFHLLNPNAKHFVPKHGG